MMTLQAIADNKKTLEEIALYLLKEKLIVHPTISETEEIKLQGDGAISKTKSYVLKSISKSVLFNNINLKLRERFKMQMPILYSEPLILMDEEQRYEAVQQIAYPH